MNIQLEKFKVKALYSQTDAFKYVERIAITKLMIRNVVNRFI